jgi:hypothetical protein
MSRIFELLNECTRCGRHSFGSVQLALLMQGTTIKFCSPRCKRIWSDTHPSDLGDIDPRLAAAQGW